MVARDKSTIIPNINTDWGDIMEILGIILTAAIAGTIPGVIAWLVNRKKNKADTAETFVKIARNLIEEFEKRVADLEIDLAKMKAENRKLRRGIERLIAQIKHLGYEPDFILEDKE